MNTGISGALALLTGGLALAAAPAWADYDRRDAYQYDYAEVVQVDPIVRYVTVETPVRECYEVDRSYRTPRRDGNVAGATIAGAIIGGIIGNQFGKGSGRDAATAAGVVIGGSIGADSARDRGYHRGRVVREPVRQCDITYETHEEERIEGYRVTYVYRGVEYRTRMDRPPGDRLKVRVLVEPVSRS